MRRSPFGDEEFRPVAIVALALAIIPLTVSLYFLVHPSSPFYFVRLQTHAFYTPIYFFVFVNTLNAVMSIGVLMRKKWGYQLFRILLYMMFFGFPIGTFVSYATLSYIRNHRIEQHFGLPPSQHIFRRAWLVITFAAAVVTLFFWMMLAY